MGRNGWICPQESPGSAHNEIEGSLVEIGSRSVFGNSRSVAGNSQRGRVRCDLTALVPADGGVESGAGERGQGTLGAKQFPGSQKVGGPSRNSE